MADAEPSNDVQSDVTIGSYRLLERLGSGGMSSVLRAEHIDNGLEVAVKILPRYLARNAVLLQRFLREAKIAESLEHPNIIAIYDRGFDQGRHYLVLEFVPGGDLHDRIKRDGPLPVAEAVRVIKEVVEGLRFAASRGLIHRDVKPANVLMTPEGRVKITDLGLALQTEDDDERVTRDGTTVGTVDYMAPEQARDSRATSVRSDIYSLGCTFYYLLVGMPPFPGGDLVEKLRRHFTTGAPDVRLARPDVPEPLARFIQRLMAKRPEDRYADYDELLAALEVAIHAKPGETGEPLYALIDDEVEPGDQAKPLYAVIDDEEDEEPAPAKSSNALFALIDDEEDPGGAGRSLPPMAPISDHGAFQLPDVNMMELAPLEDEEPPRPLAPQRPPATTPAFVPEAARAPAPPTRPRKKRSQRLQVFDEPSSESFERLMVLAKPVGSSASLERMRMIEWPADPSPRPWIVGGLLAVIAIIVLAIAGSWLSGMGSPASVDATDEPELSVESTEEDSQIANEPSRIATRAVPEPRLVPPLQP
jgi:eukaryotic-like serine/threonine-protein kinase